MHIVYSKVVNCDNIFNIDFAMCGTPLTSFSTIDVRSDVDPTDTSMKNIIGVLDDRKRPLPGLPALIGSQRVPWHHFVTVNDDPQRPCSALVQHRVEENRKVITDGRQVEQICTWMQRTAYGSEVAAS